MNEGALPDCGNESAEMQALAARVRTELALTAHPRAAWLEPRTGPDGKPALDVLIVGGGQSGIATGFGLQRARVENILVVDRAPFGQEGPWRSYARMPSLRSPKDFTGPDLGIPSLTYEAWHSARYGVAGWAALPLIRREDWADYLLWVRAMTQVPVQNDTELVDIAPAGEWLRAGMVDRTTSAPTTLYCRKLVLATGQDSAGSWWLPAMLRDLPADRRAHTADDIDFAALRGRQVAVLGAGASAFDNAATALEHGAARVTLFARRERLQVIQPYRWLTFKGFLDHLCDLDDAWRWRFMSHILGLREGFPQATYDRCARHPQFELLTGAPFERIEQAGERLVITTPKGRHSVDFIIAGTGIDMDFALRPELRGFADNIATWADRYTPPEDERHDRLGRFPYLNADFAFCEKRRGETPWIANIHLFSIASTMSFGPSGSSINAMTTAVPKLVSAITRGLFKADVERHWQSLQAYDTPQAIVPKM